MELYQMGPKERKSKGMKGYKWAIGDEAGFTSEHMSQRVVNNLDKLFETWKPRSHYELINTNQVEENKLPHKLIY